MKHPSATLKRWPGRAPLRRCLRVSVGIVCLVLAVFAGPRNAPAQARYMSRVPDEPKWLTFHLSEISAGVYAEGTYDTTRYTGTSTEVSHNHTFVGPFLGFTAEGSIYHPHLIRYYINSEGAFGWGDDRFTSGPNHSSQSQLEYLGRFSATINFLENKPYRASAFANYDHTYRDNDFFNRVTVDSWRYGARASWELGQFTLSADYSHRYEKSSNPYPIPGQGTLDQKSITDEDTATFTARHERASGGTVLNYNFTKYTRSDVASIGNGTDHSISLGDNEHWGPLDRYKLNSSLSYYRRDTSEEVSDEVIGFANFSAEHSLVLSSSADLNYDHFDTTGFTSDNYSAGASLRHQLYESLTSTVSVRGSDFESSDTINDGYTRRFGAGFSENYTKLLSDDSRLQLNNFFFLEHTDQQNIGNIKDERHSFTEARPVPNSFVLNFQQVVLSSIIITDPAKTQQYLNGYDYEVIQFGVQTEIHRLTGSAMPDTVVASYQSQPTPPGSYQTVTEAAEIRLQLWKNLLAVYGRVNLSLNDAPAELRIQNVSAYTVGSDLNWRCLRAGAEYEIYDSTESDYRTTRLYQGISFNPDAASSASLDFSETWIDYQDSDRSEQDYRFIARYHRSMTQRLAFNFDAGVAIRNGNGVDQLLAAVRPSIKYVIGKTTIDAGYDFEFERFLNAEERQKHMFTFRLRRLL